MLVASRVGKGSVTLARALEIRGERKFTFRKGEQFPQ